MCLVAIVLKSLISDSVTPGYRVTVMLQASREENTIAKRSNGETHTVAHH